MDRSRVTFTWFLTFAWTARVLGAPIPAALAVVSIKGSSAEREERALSILEARFRRWLENRGVGGVLGPLGDRVSAAALSRERLASELRETLKARELGLASPKLTSLRAQAESDPDLAPWTMRALLWESVDAWKAGNRGESERRARAALRWSPEGDAVLPGDAPDSWQEKVRSFQREGRRDCAVEVPAGGRLVRVNGFPVDPDSEIVLIGGGVRRIGWRDASGVLRVSDVRCERPGRWRLSAEFVAVSAPSLPDLVERARVASMALVEPKGDGFRLYLFTRGVGLEEIPLTRPLKLEDVLARPLDEGLAVELGAFERLRVAHRLAGAADWNPLRLEARSEPEAPRWYNNWTTWAVAGGILAGVLVAVLATRSSSVQAQPPGGLRIQLDRP